MTSNIIVCSSVLAGGALGLLAPAGRSGHVPASRHLRGVGVRAVEHAGLDPALWASTARRRTTSGRSAPTRSAWTRPGSALDGTRWTLVPDGGTTLPVSVLRSVDAISPTDVWAVGLSNPIGRWHGPIGDSPSTRTARRGPWCRRRKQPANSILTDVAAAATHDVGRSQLLDRCRAMQALILHWDGNAWTTSTGAEVTWNHALDAVAVVAPDDVWAVGRMHEEGRWTTLVEHWDGTAVERRAFRQPGRHPERRRRGRPVGRVGGRHLDDGEHRPDAALGRHRLEHGRERTRRGSRSKTPRPPRLATHGRSAPPPT